MVIDAEKQFTFESQLENEYSWSKNISSWLRETYTLSKKENNLTSELAPVKINKSFDKFDTSLAPVYIMQNNFKDKDTKQCLGVVLDAVYNMDTKNSLKVEAGYWTEPAKNLFNTRFCKFKDNMAYILSYMFNF